MQTTKKPKTEPKWERYVLRSAVFDAQSEMEFYKILRDEILGQKFVALVQVPLARIIDVRGKSFGRFDAERTRIDKKIIDFLICNKEDLRPRVALELDGSSHADAARSERDEFVDKLFGLFNFPLIRIQKADTYDAFAIATEIGKPLGIIPRRPTK
jgi:very-short-patch-repair endonuclease